MKGKKIISKVSASLLNQILDFKPENAVVIFGDPRGGSTWLAEIINTIPRSVVVWEPLHPALDSCFKKIGFSARQYIPMNAEWDNARVCFENLLKGRSLQSNSFFLSSPAKYLKAQQLIFKICRGNALIPWIVNQFNFRFKPVYLARHPFSVVASQLRHGSWHSNKPAKFSIPKGPFNEAYQEHEIFLSTLSSPEEVLTAVWCITNQVPLNHSGDHEKWITIYYENLVMDPISQTKYIFSEWGMDLPEKIENVILKKSKTTRINQFENDAINQLSKWEKYFSDEQLKKMTKVLSHFGVTKYSMESIFPI